jgi:hypothetical protein
MMLSYSKNILAFILFLSIGFFQDLNAQSLLPDSIHFTGIVYNSDSLQVISDVHVQLNKKGTQTGINGQFALWLNKGDSLNFSHVSYKNNMWIVPDTIINPDMLLGIFLSKDTSQLAEVIVYPRLPELESLMTKQVREDQELRNAKNNLQILSYQARHNPVTGWDAEMNTDSKLRAYEMNASYNGLLSPDEMVPITAIVPLAIALIVQKYSIDNKEKFKVSPLEEELIKSLYQRQKD